MIHFSAFPEDRRTADLSILQAVYHSCDQKERTPLALKTVLSCRKSGQGTVPCPTLKGGTRKSGQGTVPCPRSAFDRIAKWMLSANSTKSIHLLFDRLEFGRPQGSPLRLPSGHAGICQERCRVTHYASVPIGSQGSSSIGGWARASSHSALRYFLWMMT